MPTACDPCPGKTKALDIPSRIVLSRVSRERSEWHRKKHESSGPHRNSCGLAASPERDQELLEKHTLPPGNAPPRQRGLATLQIRRDFYEEIRCTMCNKNATHREIATSLCD
jgi:hypothetical protein